MNFGNGIEFDFTQLNDAQLTAVRAEVQAAGVERGLWAGEPVSRFTIAKTIDIEFERVRLLDTVEEGARTFNDIIAVINHGRLARDRIPVVQPGEYLERAEDWLTDERIVAAAQLPETATQRRIIFPRLHRPITHEDIMASWSRVSKYDIHRWTGDTEFIKNWTADQLSGYSPEQEDTHRFAIIPTTYDKKRANDSPRQVQALTKLQEEFPRLGVTTIFEGVLPALHCTWENGYVRGIDLNPVYVGGYRYILDAWMEDDELAFINPSSILSKRAARLQVR